MRILAPQLGLSDVGLAKTCRRESIPVPPVGYWSKRRHGRAVPRPPLPERDQEGGELRFVVRPSAPREPHVAPTLRDPALQAALIRLRSAGSFFVPSALGEMHEITESLSLALDRAMKLKQLDERGVIRPKWRKVDVRIDVQIGEASVPRVVRLVNAIVRRAESLSVLQTRKREEFRFMCFPVADREFHLSVTERCRRYPIPPRPGREAHWRPRFGMRPAGELTVQLTDGTSRVLESWHDTPHRQVEARLSRFFESLPWAVQKSNELDEAARVAEATRIEREKAEAIRRKELQLREMENARREYESLQQRAKELAEIRNLAEMAEAWSVANRIRDFVQAMRDRALRSDVPGDEVRPWLEHVWDIAERLDPQRTFPPSPPAKDVLEAIRPRMADRPRGLW